MKRFSTTLRLPFTLCLLLTLGATVASAQTPPIQHVIVIVQENRSTENLFNQDTAATCSPQTTPVTATAHRSPSRRRI